MFTASHQHSISRHALFFSVASFFLTFVATAQTTVVAPSNLVTSVVSTNSLKLTWTDNSTDETGFAIERSLTSGSGFAAVTTVAANVVSYTNTGLTAGTQYFYRIRAVKTGAYSPYTPVSSAATLLVTPTALKATVISSGQINLTWSETSLNETGFVVERSLTTATGFTAITTTDANATSYSDTGVSPVTKYYYRIRAINAVSASANTTEVNATTPIAPPNAPGNLVLSTPTTTSLKLTWTDNSTDETGFAIERSLTSGSGFAAVTTVAANVVSYTNNTGLTAGTQYFYRVRAVKTSVYSAYTPESNATTLLTLPTLLASTVASANQINLTWVDNATNETGYAIERSLTTGGNFNLVYTTASNSTSYSDTGLTTFTKYFYRIKAVNATGSSAYTAEVSNTTLLNTPTNLVATNPSSLSKINLTWSDNSASETNYLIERSTSSGNGFAPLVTLGANITSYSNTGLSAGTTYFYRVRAKNGSIYSAYSPEASATTWKVQSITFSPLSPVLFGVAPFTLTAAASSGLPITYTSSKPSVATVSGSTLTVVGVGTTTITASQPGNSEYQSAANASQVLTISQASQTITFGPLDQHTEGDAPFTISATSSAGLPVTVTSSNTAVATVAGNTITIRGTGTSIITASQSGNANYAPATAVPQTLTIITKQQFVMDNYAFQYKYDGRKRMTQKKVPGADWVYMVYDDRDRLVLTQDGNQRKTNQWTFTKYDALNRPVMTGLYADNDASRIGQANMQAYVNNVFYSASALSSNSVSWYETFTTAPSNIHGYSNQSFPTQPDPSQYLTITYYDDYSFKALFNDPENEYKPNQVSPVTSLTGTYSQAPNENLLVKGQVTGSKVKVLGQGNYLLNITYYDDKYRAIQTVSDNNLGGKDRTTNIVDFVGKVLTTKTDHSASALTWNNPGWFLTTPTSVSYTGGGGSGMITSVEKLAANTDGWFEFTQKDLQNVKIVTFGAESGNQFYLSNLWYAQEAGSNQVYGNSAVGNVYRIERRAGKLSYLVNGVTVYTSQNTYPADLQVGIQLNNLTAVASSADDIHSSFSQQQTSTTRTFEYDHAGRLLKTWHQVGSPDATIHWKDLVGVSAMGNTLTKTIADGWNAGAASMETLPAGIDGWAEFTVTSLAPYQMLGFSAVNADASYASINYALYQAQGQFAIYESGNNVGPIVGLTVGSVMRVERKGTAINYYLNSTLMYTSLIPSTSQLLLDVSQYTGGASLNNIRTSFVDGGQKVLLAKNDYNELGQLVTKNLYNPDPATANDNTKFKQNVDYRYNIRGWLTNVNDAAAAPTSNDLFGMELKYNNPSANGGLAQFNGNISESVWRGIDGAVNSYGYNYDAMNRLTTANYFNQASSTKNGRFNESIGEYDLNGNIKSLTRNGKTGIDPALKNTTYGVMDQLTYSNYKGNQLYQVTDSGAKPEGFKDGANTGNDYDYDANGNMTTDLNKDISLPSPPGGGQVGAGAITYNHLNLPAKVNKANGDYVAYTYDATGRKLRQQVYKAGKNTPQKTTDYAGEFYYENDTLKFINHEEGRVVMKPFVPPAQLFTSPDCNDPNAFALVNINSGTAASITSSSQGGETYVKVQASNQYAGALTKAIAVEPGQQYELKIRGYVNRDNALVYVQGPGESNILWPGSALPSGAASEGWVQDRFTVPPNVSSVYIGALFNFSPTQEDAIYFNTVELYKVSPGQAQGVRQEYQYHLKDHLGNVRVTFTTKDEEEKTTATYEVATRATENSQYIGLNDARLVYSELFNHAEGQGVRPGYSQRLNGSANEKVGLARSISVMPGDIINMKVYAKYVDPNTNNWSAALSGLVTSIATGSGLGTSYIDGSGYSAASGKANPGWVGGTGNTNSSDGAPLASMNYVFIGRDFDPASIEKNFTPITTLAMESGNNGPHQELTLTYVAKTAGYMYIYLANDSETANPKDVFFDDFTVTQTKSPVVQADDYYAFGLTFNSYSRENSVANKYLYNGKELQTDLGLNWADYGARMYMSDIGRWGVVDPHSENNRRWSPFVYALNNPTRFVDLDGKDPYLIYDGKTKTLRIYDNNKTAGNYKDDKLLGTFPAHNNVDSKSKGKWEDGKYAMLDKNTRKTSEGKYEDDKKTPQDSKNGRYGEGGIYRAEEFKETTTNTTRSGMAVHAGRQSKDFESRYTMGCIRTTPEAMVGIDNAIKDYGPLQSTIVQNNRESDNSASVNNINPSSSDTSPSPSGTFIGPAPAPSITDMMRSTRAPILRDLANIIDSVFK